jgi:hypothetical protein
MIFSEVNTALEYYKCKVYILKCPYEIKKNIVICPLVTNSAVNGLQVFVRRRSFVRLSNPKLWICPALNIKQTNQVLGITVSKYIKRATDCRTLQDCTIGQNSLVLFDWVLCHTDTV